MADHELSLRGFSLAVGIERETLRKWFQTEGSALSRRFLEHLASLFQIPVERAITESGGTTANDKHRAIGLTIGTKNLVQSFETDRAKRAVYDRSARSRRGQKPSPAALAKREQTMRERGSHDHVLSKLQQVNGTQRAALARGLGKRLGRTPSPTQQDIQQWALSTSQRVGLPTKTVLAIWRPYLQRVGLVRAGGRSSEEERCQRIRALMATWPRTRKGLADGFWVEAAIKEETDYKSLKEWWRVHRPVCAVSLAELGRPKNSAISTQQSNSPVFTLYEGSMNT